MAAAQRNIQSTSQSGMALRLRIRALEGGVLVDVYEEGGVFLLDEIDAADANVLLVITLPLAHPS